MVVVLDVAHSTAVTRDVTVESPLCTSEVIENAFIRARWNRAILSAGPVDALSVRFRVVRAPV